MSTNSNFKEAKLWLRICTLRGILYENHVKSVKIQRRDGTMIINANYSSVMEQLADGPLVIQELTRKIVFEVQSGWLTVGDNRCNVYTSDAKIVS